MPETLIVVPTFNELDNLASIVARLRSAVPSADVLIVDDASPDGTGELADRLAATDARIRVLHRAGKAGLGGAYLAGFAQAIAEDYTYVVEIDADGSHDPAELPAMLELAAHGADLVIGSRWVDGGSVLNWPRHRRAISRAGNAYSRWMLRSSIRDITAGFRVFRVSALQNIASTEVSSQGYCFQVELAWRLERTGHRIEEHPITFVERVKGRSKMHLGIVLEALFRVTAWGLRRP
ncbi:MAG: polyprenol monophosphomannose synthase [Salinibacterium sp.]|nr:polyprenol monophosphomannose synthase [Salinibacterium sp.]